MEKSKHGFRKNEPQNLCLISTAGHQAHLLSERFLQDESALQQFEILEKDCS